MAQYTKEAIRALLERSDKAVEQAIIRLWERQTADEQEAKQTGHKNGLGFNGTDAEILTSFAEHLQGIGYMEFADGKRVARKGPKPLTAGQMTIARKKVVKYAGQLAEIANAKAAEREAGETTPATTGDSPAVSPAPAVTPAPKPFVIAGMTDEQSSKLEALDAIARMLAMVMVGTAPEPKEAAYRLGVMLRQAKETGILTVQAQRYIVAQADHINGHRSMPGHLAGQYVSYPGYQGHADEAHAPFAQVIEPAFDEVTAELIAAGVLDPQSPAPSSAWYSYTDGGLVRAEYTAEDYDRGEALDAAPEPERLPGSVCLCPEGPCDIHHVVNLDNNAALFDAWFGPDRQPTERQEIRPSDLAHFGPADNRYPRRGRAEMRHAQRGPVVPNRIRC